MGALWNRIRPVRKAVVAGLSTSVGALVTGFLGDMALSQTEVSAALSLGVAAAWATFGVKNKDKR